MENSSTYKIVQDVDALHNFINNVLPDIDKGEKFYMALFARKKYSDDPRFKADKSQLKSLLTTKERMVTDLLKLEVSDGLYTSNDVPVHQHMLAMYINPNPRSMHKAGLRLLREMAVQLERGEQLNPKRTMMSAAQVCASRKIYVNIDIDLEGFVNNYTSSDLVKEIELGNFVNTDAIKIVATRGGFHVLVETAKIAEKYKNTWFNGFRNIEGVGIGVDMRNRDGLLPLVGCSQGGFVPKLIEL